MYCKNCGSELQNGLQFCSDCGEAVNGVNTEKNSKKSKKAVCIAVCVILAVALTVGTVFLCFSYNGSAFDRLTSATLNTFSSPCKITVTDLSGDVASLLGGTSVELVIPDALIKGRYSLTAGDISYYRQDGFEYYSYESNAGLFRRVAPDNEVMGIELDISKYFDYLAHIASGDYKALAELINSETFAEDVINVGRFIKRVNEIIDTYFSDEYMTENYGFVYTEEDQNGKYSFSLSVNKAIDTLYEIIQGSKDCFATADEYNMVLDNIRDARNEMGKRGDETTVGIEITVSNELIRDINVKITENDESVSAGLEFSDYGTATVGAEICAEFDTRKEQLGQKDYLVWYGPITYSDYYEKD